ncbi:hypothetical protein GOBAR_DD27066 [Gossypium barbadense]|nr:hypothetical protein GOBAR_DD27066 [Gossypium barbadense]
MTLYIGREASKLWKRICSETTTEINLLLDNWKYLLAGLIFQLLDEFIDAFIGLGQHFRILGSTSQELGQDEPTSVKLCSLLLSFIVDFPSSSSSACSDSGPNHSHSILLRLLTNYHCREGSSLPDAKTREVGSPLRLIFLGCKYMVVGGLIFHHTLIFTPVLCLTYQKYGTRSFIMPFAGVGYCSKSLDCGIRKHYTGDVVVAGIADRSSGSSHVAYHSRTKKNKDSKTKKRTQALEWNSVGSCRMKAGTHVNGKISEMKVESHDTAMNGA